MKKETIAMINRNVNVSPKELKEILKNFFTLTGETAIEEGNFTFCLGSATTYQALKEGGMLKEGIFYDLAFVDWIAKRIGKFVKAHTFEGYSVFNYTEGSKTASYFKD